MGRLQKGINDLESWCLNNGEFGKQLMNEWTGGCEDGNTYKIDEVTKASNKKFNWICSKEHEWLARVNDRTRGKAGCPYCFRENHGKLIAKAKLSEKNSLKAWCLNNGLFGEQLISEWTGECEDSKHYKINDVSFGSHKKFKWRCSKRHEWFAKINSRTSHKSGCPYCSGKLVSNGNSLKNWCLSNGSYGQKLIFEWTGECEDATHCKIDEVTRASHKKFKWRCSNGHEWYATIANRTGQKQGCPYCNHIQSSLFTTHLSKYFQTPKIGAKS